MLYFYILFFLLFIFMMYEYNIMNVNKKITYNNYNNIEKIQKCYSKYNDYYKCRNSKSSGELNFYVKPSDRYTPLSDNYRLFPQFKYRKYTKFLIYIVCLCKQHIEREAVRRTWYRNDNLFTTVFIVGETNKECDLNLRKENKIKKDIIRINIIENYFNNTLFTIYLLKLLPELSQNIEYFIKASLDILINWKILEPQIFSIIRNDKDSFIVPRFKNVFYSLSNDIHSKYSSSNDAVNYYNKLFPKGGLKCFDGFFYIHNRYLGKILYNESSKYPILIGCEDQYISWLFYSLKINKYKILKHVSLTVNKDVNKNKEYSIIHRIDGIDLLSLYKFLNIKII